MTACPDCHYKRTSVNHKVLCLPRRPWGRKRYAAEQARLIAADMFTDTPEQQAARRAELDQALRKAS